jgi:hypothetical protein
MTLIVAVLAFVAGFWVAESSHRYATRVRGWIRRVWQPK